MAELYTHHLAGYTVLKPPIQILAISTPVLLSEPDANVVQGWRLNRCAITRSCMFLRVLLQLRLQSRHTAGSGGFHSAAEPLKPAARRPPPLQLNPPSGESLNLEPGWALIKDPRQENKPRPSLSPLPVCRRHLLRCRCCLQPCTPVGRLAVIEPASAAMGRLSSAPVLYNYC